MLIEDSDLGNLTPACDPGAERYNTKAHLVAGLAETLPYLSATLPERRITRPRKP